MTIAECKNYTNNPEVFLKCVHTIPLAMWCNRNPPYAA